MKRLLPVLAAVAVIAVLVAADALGRAAATSPTAAWARPLFALPVAVLAAGAVLSRRF